MAKKQYVVQHGIGKARHMVSFWDGVKTHADGSRFFDISIFSNEKSMLKFTSTLRARGYTLA